MSKAPFIDLDAQFIYDLGQAMIDDDDGDLVQALRLCKIAERLERMNRADMERQSKGDFAAGALDMAARIYSRSNLPPDERTMPVALAKTGLKPTVIPAGATAKKLERLEKKAAEEKKVLSRLSGIKLNLSPILGAKK